MTQFYDLKGHPTHNNPVKMKYPDSWQQKVMNAPVKYFETAHANAWDKQSLNAKVRSWSKQFKGYTCTQSPISDYCKKGICVKKKHGILAGSKGSYPVLTNLKKIESLKKKLPKACHSTKLSLLKQMI